MTQDLTTLIRRFQEGVLWINQALRAGRNPWLQHEIARFEREVVGPMNEKWNRMTQEEKKEWLKTKS